MAVNDDSRLAGRAQVVQAAAEAVASGRLRDTLARAVAHRTESQVADNQPVLRSYLVEFLGPWLDSLGFSWDVYDNPVDSQGPLLVARRTEAPDLPTMLCYGHGDVVRGDAARWREGLDPWTLQVEGDRWYGRGAADNKGQHIVNLLAFEQVLQAREGRMGFNTVLLFESSEETGSPGLRAFCEAHAEVLAADVFLSSDGPRVAADRATLFLGSRGACAFDLTVDLRQGAHHSGNWGGLLRNPAVVLAHALACLVDGDGRMAVDALRPASLPASVRAALRDIPVGGGPNDPEIDVDWGEPGLTPAERVYGWNTLEVLAMGAGNPQSPANAIPGRATARCQVRFVAGSDSAAFLPAVRAHLDAHGFGQVVVTPADTVMQATRLDPDDPWVQWALASMALTLGRPAALLPNLGGSLPNDVFAEVLGLPTLWVPHSYAACAQHAPDEHALGSILHEGLRIMAGLYWDLGEAGVPAGRRR